MVERYQIFREFFHVSFSHHGECIVTQKASKTTITQSSIEMAKTIFSNSGFSTTTTARGWRRSETRVRRVFSGSNSTIRVLIFEDSNLSRLRVNRLPPCCYATALWAGGFVLNSLLRVLVLKGIHKLYYICFNSWRLRSDFYFHYSMWTALSKLHPSYFLW